MALCMFPLLLPEGEKNPTHVLQFMKQEIPIKYWQYENMSTSPPVLVIQA